MKIREYVRWMIGVLVAIAAGLAITGTVIVSHHASNCFYDQTDNDVCPGRDALFSGAALAFGAAGSLLLGCLVLLMFLKHTGPNPPR